MKNLALPRGAVSSTIVGIGMLVLLAVNGKNGRERKREEESQGGYSKRATRRRSLFTTVAFYTLVCDRERDADAKIDVNRA